MSDDAKRLEAAALVPERPRPTRRLDLAGLSLGTVGEGVLESAAEQKLQVLDLEGRSISAVPAVVYRSFSWLRVLDLRRNALEELLPDIAVMAGLEELLLDQNRLRAIPVAVCELPVLKALSLSQNQLSGLPEAIGGMGSLKTLTLGDNCLEELPAGIGGCRSLRTLYLHHNHFTVLPTTIGQLEGLTEMALEWFRYTSPPLPRVFKGPEWRQSIQKFLVICRGKREQGEAVITCTEVLKQFSQKAFDPNAIDSKRRTRLHVSCLEGHVGVAMALAESGSRLDSLDNEGYSALLIAVREEKAEIARALIRAGVEVDKGGGLYGSPLHVATVNFDPDMVSLLIGGKADPNQTDADGNAPLHVLMSVFDKGPGKACVVGEILLEHGADCNMLNNDKWAPVHLAARRGQLRGICFVLLQADAAARLRRQDESSNGEALQKGSPAGTCFRVFDLNLRGGSHLWTPLHLSGHASHLSVVQALVEAGADVFLRNVDFRTPRHVSRGNLAISKLLRKAEDEWLWCRLHGAAEGPAAEAAADRAAAQEPTHRQPGQSVAEAVEAWARRVQRGREALKETQGGSSGSSGPPLAARDRAQCRLHRVAAKCRGAHLFEAELEQLQAANFAFPPSSVDNFVYAFTKVLQQGPKHKFPILLSRPWAKEMLPELFEDEQGQSALLHPAVVANEDVVRLLISSLPRDRLALFGRVRSRDGETWIHALCKGAAKAPATGSRSDVLCLLLAVCPPDTFDLEAVDHRGQTALHLAAQCGEIGLVQVLLEAGADPNAREETTGWTPLHFAVSKAHYGLIMQLLHHETAKVNQVDKFDWPPLFEACSRLDPRSVALLANAGASLEFKNQHDFDVLKAVDTSKKDLPAKRWMSCLVVSNGFRFQGSTVQLSNEDRDTLQRERAFFEARSAQEVGSLPPFYVPDHLAPRCQACKVLVSGISTSRNHCRSCGMVLCTRCTLLMHTTIVHLDERLRSQRPARRPGGGAVRASPLSCGRAVAAAGGGDAYASGDYEEPELAEEVPVTGAGLPGAGPAAAGAGARGRATSPPSRGKTTVRGSLVRDRGPAGGAAAGREAAVRLCAQCAAFHEVGVGETYSMLQRSGF